MHKKKDTKVGQEKGKELSISDAGACMINDDW